MIQSVQLTPSPLQKVVPVLQIRPFLTILASFSLSLTLTDRDGGIEQPDLADVAQSTASLAYLF